MARAKCSSASTNWPLRKEAQTHGIVEARIVRVAPQAFAPVRLRRPRGMTVLLKMQAGQIELLDACNLLRRRGSVAGAGGCSQSAGASG